MKLSDLKSFVNDPLLYKAFGEYLEVQIVKAYQNMERHTEPYMFYREQGKVEILKRLKQMKDEVNSADGQGSLFK